MKSSAPWSVKGIERDARETAKEAAKRQGMTVGEWLNQVIYSAGDPEPSDGDIEGLKLRDLVTAIEHLHKRLAEADVKSNDAIGELTRQFGGVVERVQRLERVKPAEGSAPEGSYDDLAERLKKIEEKGGDRQRVDALRALEKAVGQVAVQFNTAHKESLERLDATERQVQSLGERIDGLGDNISSVPAGANALKSAVEDLTERVARAETIASEATRLRDEAMAAADPDFVERTGERLRILGDEIKRGGDQIRALENALSKISDQIEAAEKRSADGVRKVTETISELRESIAADPGHGSGQGDNGAPDHAAIVEIAVTAARQTTESQIGAIQAAVRDVAKQLEGFDPSAAGGRVAPAAEKAVTDDGEQDDSAAEAQGIAPLAFDIEDHDAPSQARDEDASRSGTDDDDDPFSFSENDFASLTEEPKKSDAAGKSFDDFAFDLDDDDGDAPEAKKDAADDPMSEIADPSAPAGKYDDLDDILADLDPTAPASEAPASETGGAPSGAAMGLAAPQPSKISKRLNVGKDDAGEDSDGESEDRPGEGQQTEGATRPTRRDLTAKQKAILAARARQKRKAAGKAGGGEAARKDEFGTKDGAGKGQSRAHGAGLTLGDAPVERDFLAQEEDDDPSSDGAGDSLTQSAVKWVKARFSRDKASSDDDAPDQETPASAFDRDDAAEDSRGAEASALAGLKASAGARPVTLALGAAIVLALGALFFLVRDILFKPDAAAPAPIASQSAAPQPAGDAAAGADAGTADDTASGALANGDNVVSPRALYLDSIAALNAAGTPTDASAAIRKLEEAAALGHPPAQLQLGELYKTGQGVEEDLGQARIWFRRSANGGNVLAMHRIGVMTARGDGGPADAQAAVNWFERAANRGLVDSQYNLGAIYHPTENGGAGLQDAGQAYYWYSLASRNGDAQAEPLAAGVSSALSQAERQEIDRRVTAWQAEEPDPAANEVAPAE